MARILVVDDQHLIRSGIVTLLRTVEGLGPVVEASDGVEAVAAAREHHPELILMDIKMPRLSGLAAAERILALGLDPAPRIVVLTTFDDDEFVYAALRAGCSGFLLKDMPPQQLLGAVTATLSADLLVAPAHVRRLIERYVVQRPPSPPGADSTSSLTGREVEVLGFVAMGLANEDIATRLCVSESTVKTHLHRLMTKLDLHSRAQAVVFAYETGIARVGGRPDAPGA
ncbi:response regulator [Streptomyces rishiriensis]|uniref:DNA-binding NarL/FixJ family response regulator n=1 Tax=Streptomyces rishiriensis TaxID=68264 RepID=A0ABU0P1R1_STRRH|nr:response regulator transcription factor [Streptomyces rishiriensis]MDQ0584888.1 DNA-binding NarL/FixJ family response regulator [Streptomyces rishiriensis]